MRSCGTSRRPRRDLLAVHRVRQLSPPLPESHAGSRRQCGVCSWRRQRGQGLGLESPVPGQSSEFRGAYRFERPIDACELALGLENTPQRRVSLEWNERKFLSLLNAVLAWGGTKGISYPYPKKAAFKALGLV